MSGTVSLVTVRADVNPVPWTQAHMAFTLAFPIVLVPLTTLDQRGLLPEEVAPGPTTNP